MAKKTSSAKIQEQPQSTNNTNGLHANGGGQQETLAAGDGEISGDEIARRAYSIYEREGRSDGRDMDHWFRAESELRAELRNRPAPQNAPRSARQFQPGAAPSAP